jgi:serine phosphatase RsbU (regulator of sigma subunit)
MRVAMVDVLRVGQPVTAKLTSGPVRGWVLLKPIRSGGSAIGVLTLVNRADRRAFSSEEIRLARAMADRAGVAILNAKLATERAGIAETLQRALMPPILPEVSGWSLAAMYRPAGEVTRAGGDFYDVFEGRDGWVVVLGDVEGHGAEAAALTAMVRYTVRTAGIIDGDLLQAFRILNRQLRARERPMLCSVVCLTLGPGAEATVVSAGHPLPLLVAEGASREVGLPGSLLGALEEPQWSPVSFTVKRGEELVAYTDGVVEARRNGDRFGRERLAALLAPPGGPAEVVQRVGDAIEQFSETVQDDAAMLVLRRDRELEESDEPSTQVAQEIA